MDKFRTNQATNSQNYHKINSNPLSHKIMNSNSTTINGLNNTFVPNYTNNQINNNNNNNNNLTSTNGLNSTS